MRKTNRVANVIASVLLLLVGVAPLAFADHDELEDMLDDATERARRIVESSGILVRYSMQSEEEAGPYEVAFGSKGGIYYIKSEGE